SSVDELRKLKLWTIGDDPMGGALAKKLNLNGVPLGVPEVDAALTSGKIEACFSSPLGAIALQWYTKVKYMSGTPMVFAIGATVMSLDSAKNVSEADRKTVEKIAKRSQKKARTVIRRANEDARKTILRKGIQVVEVPKPMLDELTAAAAQVQAELTGTLFSKDELETVLRYRDEYRAKQSKS